MNTTIKRLGQGLTLLRNLTISNIGKRGPLCVDLAVTSACNHRCYFCHSHSIFRGDIPKAETLKDEELEELFQDFVTLGVSEVVLSGNGEPLMIPRIWHIIDSYAHRIGIKVLTNGTSLKKMTAERFSLLRKVTVSINGFTPDSHHRVHAYELGKQGNQLADIMAQIERLLRLPDAREKLQINTVLTKDNIAELPLMLDLAAKWDLYFAIRPVHLGFDELRDSGVALSDEDFENVRRECEKRLEEEQLAPRLRQSVIEAKVALARHQTAESADIAKLSPCYMGFYWNYIASNGDFQQCTYSSTPLGNIKETRLRDLWRTSGIQERLYRATLMGHDMKPVYPSCVHCLEPHAYSSRFHSVFSRVPLSNLIMRKRLDSLSGNSC